MIKFENTQVFNFEGAIRGMRNPLNSWDKSDSGMCLRGNDDCKVYPACECVKDGTFDEDYYCIGCNDLELMKKLIKGGRDHRKFMRQIFICVDITAPLYWWKEFDTYKVGMVSNSCSTMHTIHEKELTIKDFSYEHLYQISMYALENIIDVLNHYREKYIDTKDKKYWQQMIQLLPSSYNQKRTVTMSYENVYNIRHSQRATHKLDEWRIGFMNWSYTLPYAEELLK